VLVRAELNHAPESVVQAYQEAAAIAAEAGDERLRGAALESMGMLSLDADGDAMLEQAEAIFRQIGSEDDLARVAINQVAHELDVGRDQDALVRSQDAVSLVRRLGNRHGIGLSLMNQAIALILLGRPGEGRPLLREGLAQFQEIGEVKGQVLSIEVGSAIAASAGHARDAAILLGATHAGYDELDLEPEPSDRRLLAWTEAALATVDPSLLAGWIEEGRRLDVEAALEVWRRVDAAS
jgi:hypothetical protein